MNKIDLSICVPTFNRVELLKICLASIFPALKENPSVELIVIDNCSTDGTADYLAGLGNISRFKHISNDSNIGPGRNMFKTVEQAQGEFCWIIGNDDLIKKESIPRLLSLIKTNPDIDFYYSNIEHIDSSIFMSLKDVTSVEGIPPQSCSNYVSLRHDVVNINWEKLLDPKINDTFFGATQVSVFRKKYWDENIYTVKFDELYSDLDNTYPHSKIFAKAFINKRAYYICEPQLIVIDGYREWWDLQPMIVAIRMNQLLDWYKDCGVDKKIVSKCRVRLLKNCVPVIKMILNNPGKFRNKFFSFRYFLLHYGYKPAFVIEFFKIGIFNKGYRYRTCM